MKKILIALSIFINQYAFSHDYDETISIPPEKINNELPILPTLCKSKDKSLWDTCYSIVKESEDRNLRELRIKSFKLKNPGGNKSFPPTGFLTGRDFEFNFEDLAQSDLSLLVWDIPTERDSSGHLMLMTFIPRKVIPSVKYESINKLIVTLPTNETVTYDAFSKEILSGVLTEKPLQTDKNGNALRPRIGYVGSGLVIIASRLANYPVGDEFVSKKPAKNLADIVYNQKLICRIPVKNLWYTDYQKGGQVLLKPEFSEDKPLISYIEKTCKVKLDINY